MVRFAWIKLLSMVSLGLVLAACGGGGGDDAPPPPTTFTVGGTVSGLSGTVMLRLNGGNDLTVGAPGSFTFSTGLTNGSSYAVTLASQPPGQVCGPMVTNGTGTIASANVTNVAVACATYSIGGTVAGLAGAGLVVQLNGVHDLAVAAQSTAFTFPASATLNGLAYVVTIKAQPAGQTCTIVKSLGTVSAAAPNVSTSEVVCSDNVTDALSGVYRWTSTDGDPAEWRAFLSFSPDGTYVYGIHELGCGPAGQGGVEYGIYRWNEDSHDFVVPRVALDTDGCGIDEGTAGTLIKRSDGSLLFSGIDPDTGDPTTATFAPVASTTGTLIGAWGDNSAFTVYSADGTLFQAETKALQQIPANTVGIEDGCYTLSGTTAAGSYTANLGASCALGGGQTGVDTTGANFGLSAFATQGRDFTVTGDSMQVRLVPGFPAMLTVPRIPFAPDDASTFTVGGTITGLTGTGLVLRMNGQAAPEFNVSVPAGATSFVFPARLPEGAAYNASVAFVHPSNPSQFCRATSGGIGRIGTSHVANVAIQCSNSSSYTVQGVISGLNANGLTLRMRHFDPALNAFVTTNLGIASGAATFAFPPNTVPANVGFNLGISTQPIGQTCIVRRGANFSLGPAPVGNVEVQCATNTTDPLTGTYSAINEDGDGRGYVNFNADGTLTTVLIHADPSTSTNPDCELGDPLIDARRGNGVEYGAFNWDAATGETLMLPSPAIDTNGDCGFWEGVNGVPDVPWAYLNKIPNALEYRETAGGPADLTFTAVESVPGTLVGAFVPEANDGTLIVFHADGTFASAITQPAFLFPAGYGQERGCYTIAGSNIMLSIEDSCRPDGFAAYDLNGIAGGFAPNGLKTAGPFPFGFNDPNTLVIFGQVWKRTAP